MRHLRAGAELVLALSLVALLACGNPTVYGTSVILETPSPSPTKTRPSSTPTRTPSKTAEPTPTRTGPSYEAQKYTIVIENTHDQYQPRELPRALRVGDVITFINKDPHNKHSLTEGRNQQEPDPLFDSGVLDTGDSKRIRVTEAWKPGRYYYHCSVVPYIQTQGPFQVVE